MIVKPPNPNLPLRRLSYVALCLPAGILFGVCWWLHVAVSAICECLWWIAGSATRPWDSWGNPFDNWVTRAWRTFNKLKN